MNILLNHPGKRVFIALVALTSLNGCVAVPYGSPYYAEAPMNGGPIYAAPAPVYVQPPVYFNFGFGYWGGGQGYHGGRGYHHRH